jgi:hypothetical protein
MKMKTQVNTSSWTDYSWHNMVVNNIHRTEKMTCIIFVYSVAILLQ